MNRWPIISATAVNEVFLLGRVNLDQLSASIVMGKSSKIFDMIEVSNCLLATTICSWST